MFTPGSSWGRRLAASGVATSLLMTSAWSRAEICGPGSSSCHSTVPSAAQGQNGGGFSAIPGYPPLALESGKLVIEASSVATNAAEPGIDISTAGAAYGSGGREPIAIGYVTYKLLPAPGQTYLKDRPSYSFSCKAGDPLCHDDLSVATTGQGHVVRRYRVTKVDGATLPADVKTAPILADYAMGFTQKGIREGAPAHVFRAQTSVQLGGDRTYCNWLAAGPTCARVAPQAGEVPATAKGTMRREVLIGGTDPLYLTVVAKITPDKTGEACKPRNEIQGSPCLKLPWEGSGHAVADPYVHVDPAWPHAAAVKVEMAEDETEATWVVPKRTPLDLETLTLGPEGVVPGGPDAGPGGGPGAGTSDGGPGGATGGAAEDTPASADSGGCHVPRSSGRSGALSLAAITAFVAAALGLRRRSRARGR